MSRVTRIRRVLELRFSLHLILKYLLCSFLLKPKMELAEWKTMLVVYHKTMGCSQFNHISQIAEILLYMSRHSTNFFLF